MQVDTCIRDMCKASGASMRGVSAALGKSPAYVRLAGKAGGSPALATVADVADALGYRLAVVDAVTGETVGTIEAPRRAGASSATTSDGASG